MVLAAFAGLVLILSACEQLTAEQPTNSPETTPSTSAVSAAPTSKPTPATIPPVTKPPAAKSTATPPAVVTSPSPKASPRPAKLVITSLPFHMGEVGLAYATVTLGASGGVKPYKWSISSGALPPGLALSPGGKATGTPTSVGTFSFVARVADSAGVAAGVARTIFVFRQIAFTTTSATCDVFGNPVSCTAPPLNYNGGASSASPKVNVTPNPGYPGLPPGSSFTAKSGVVTFNIPGPACNASNYDSIVSVVLVDQSPCGAGFNCTSGKLSLTLHMSNNC